MERLPNGYCLTIGDGCFPLSTDSMVLSSFVRLPKNARVLDLGSGCGTLGLLLCAANDSCTVTGLEIDETAHRCALDNIRANKLDDRLQSVCQDLRSYETGGFDVCISNPPYFTGGPAAKLTSARREDSCSTEELFRAAAKALRYGGDLFLVHRPERLAQLCACAEANGLAPKRLQLVRHKAGNPVNLILLSCRKGGKHGLVWEELTLHNADGTPTEEYRSIYHI